MTRFLQGFSLGLVVMGLLAVLPARSHNLPGTRHNRIHAITYAFCHTLKPCPLGAEALDVARCESGPNYWNYAHNGPLPFTKNQETYAGMFQFGSYARSSFGFSWSPWQQARSAYRYWLVAGWSPWSCA